MPVLSFLKDYTPEDLSQSGSNQEEEPAPPRRKMPRAVHDSAPLQQGTSLWVTRDPRLGVALLLLLLQLASPQVEAQALREAASHAANVEASQVQQPRSPPPSDSEPPIPWTPHCGFTQLHPRRYAAFHLPPPSDESSSPSSTSAGINIDGVLDESAWAEVPWSEAFQDIQGPQFWSQPWFTTRYKLRYDEQFLYIAAYLEETAVWANVSERNDVIFHDNDFEVFVDADGSTHNYKEFELNARNATWNLWLNRPYRDGGHENSSRVDPLHGFDMLSSGMRSAVFVPGHINDPGERLHYWTAEIALPLSQLALHSKAQVPPTPLTFWRINFSRVEWPVRLVTNSQTGKQHYEKEPGRREENWVWSAQYAVDMHRPEWWGYLQFRPRSELPPSLLDNRQPSEVAVPLDPEWSVRYVSFQFYYAQHAFHKATRSFTSHMEELLPFVTSREALGCMTVLDIHASTESFTARIASKHPGSNKDLQLIATIKDDGYIVVGKMSSTDMAATYE